MHGSRSSPTESSPSGAGPATRGDAEPPSVVVSYWKPPYWTGARVLRVLGLAFAVAVALFVSKIVVHGTAQYRCVTCLAWADDDDFGLFGWKAWTWRAWGEPRIPADFVDAGHDHEAVFVHSRNWNGVACASPIVNTFGHGLQTNPDFAAFVRAERAAGRIDAGALRDMLELPQSNGPLRRRDWSAEEVEATYERTRDLVRRFRLAHPDGEQLYSEARWITDDREQLLRRLPK